MSIFVFFFLLLSFSLSVNGQRNESVYEVLKRFSLPRGILPHGVTDYDLNTRNGLLKVYFNRTCQFPMDSYRIKYASTISGIISPGRIRQVRGVSIRVIFFWLNVGGLYRDDDELDFSFGIASEDVPIRHFAESPICGCGFYCNGLVSSS